MTGNISTSHRWRASRPRAHVFAALLVSVAVTAAAGPVDVGKSQVTATFRQMNVPVDGRFNRFQGNIDFDAKNPAAARARIDIDTASFDVGAPEYNDELRKKEWFDASAYPRASFVSTRVVATEKDRFEVTGKLTLKGKIQELKVAVVRRSDRSAQVYEGELPISRKAFAIGGADWDSTVADRVIVKFRIVSP